MSKRRLLFYTHALVGGGAERVWARLASGFAARGDAVTFAVDFEAQESLPYLSKGVDLHVLPRGHARATLGLARLLTQTKPDASLSAISVSNLKHVAAAALARRADRAIIGYHGFFRSEPEPLSRIGYLATPLLSRLAAATVAVSRGLRDELVASFFVPIARAGAIYNPATPEPFPPALAADELAARPPRIVAAGRLAPDKDFLTLLRAFARLQRPEARLVILGEGPERRALEEEAQRLGVAAQVDMPGYCADVQVQLAQARCCAVSSLRESFSLICVEALAQGLPVVATRCGGPAEILDAPDCGSLVPVGDAASLALKLAAALDAPGDPAPRQARAKAFSLDAALNEYDALIGAVIRRARQ
jgi:glycosyltransferase involved in cell wall biosynthesis